MKKVFSLLTVLIVAAWSQSCFKDHSVPIPEPTILKSDPFVNNLKAPIGLALDDKGKIRVTEA
jgi:hypothetical protein